MFGQLRLLLARNLREGFRTPVLAYVVPIVIPLALLVLVAETLARVTDLPDFPTRNYAEWMTPAIIMLTAMTGVGYAAMSLIVDIQSGYIDRLRLLDVRPAALLESRVLFDAVRVVPAGVVVLLVGMMMGAELRAGPLDIFVLFGLLTLWSVAYGGLFFVVALLTRNAQAPFALTPLFLPLQFLSTQFCPKSVLPHWAQSASRWNPFDYMVEASRALTTGPYSALAVVRAFDVALLLLVVTQYVSFRALSRVVNDQ